MTKKDLRSIVGDLENACARLDYILIEEGDDPARLQRTAVDFGNTLIQTWHRLTTDPSTPEERIAKAVCPRCGMTGRLLWHYDAGTCVEQHGEPGWAKAKRLARDGEPTDF